MNYSGAPRRLRGTVEMWDDEKGFGFITAEEGGPDVFLHIAALSDTTVRPAIGQPITYCLTTDKTGRPRAAYARVEAVGQTIGSTVRAGPKAPRRSGSGRRFWPPLVAITALGGMAGAAQSGLLAWWVPAIYSAASFATFLAYAWDKVRAIDGEWRVSEGTLHWLEFFGGWPGALIAQQFFRHKTSKADYQITFWLIVAAHVGSWLWWVFGRGKI